MTRMSRSPKKANRAQLAKRAAAEATTPVVFDEVLELISAARLQTAAAVNTALIDLYWSIGRYISQKVARDSWGQGTVRALAEYIQRRLGRAWGGMGVNA
jgi:hypothetical protein